MRRLLLFGLCSTLLASAVQAGPIDWRTDFEVVLDEAILERKPIFVTFYTDWCGWCKRLDRTVFVDSTFADRLNTYYVPARIHGEQQRGIAAMFQVRAYPTTIFLTRTGEEIGRLQGYRPPDEFSRLLLAVLPHREKHFESTKKKLAKAPNDPQLLYAWGETLFALGRMDEAASVFETILNSDHPEAEAWSVDAELDYALTIQDPQKRLEALEIFCADHVGDDRRGYALVEYGLTLIELGHPERADESFRAAVKFSANAYTKKRARQLLER